MKKFLIIAVLVVLYIFLGLIKKSLG